MNLDPCVFCGTVPTPDPGLAGVPESAGFVSCPTVHLSGEMTAGCPAYAEDGEAWNYLMRKARARLVDERGSE